MDKMKMETPDPTQENVEKLLALFPECATEVKQHGKVTRGVNFDILQQLLTPYKIEGEEAYEFTWVGKKAAFVEANRPIRKTLRPVPEKSKDWQKTENLYIEGDNLEALKLLREAYLGQVKMIYIDPPYNTGNDFIYNDSFKMSEKELTEGMGLFDEEGNKRFTENSVTNPRFHSDWCSMIYARLLVAKNLLAEDGLLFISIDDNEQYNLKKICDEVFGCDNFINQIAWVSNITGRQIAGYGVAKTWETVLVYGKNAMQTSSLTVSIKYAKEKMPDAYKGFSKEIHSDEHGEFTVGDTLYNHNRKFNEETRRNLVFSIFYNPQTGEIQTGNIGEAKEGFVEIKPHPNGDGVHKYHAWRWSKPKIQAESYNLVVMKVNKGYEIYTKIRDFNRTTLKDIITNIKNGDSELRKLFGDKRYFDFPKSVDLLKTLLSSTEEKDSLVLDFFSGSATTAHAVMQMNAEDGGHRRFIMVQLPEKTDEKSEAKKAGFDTICDIGEERIRRAGEKIKEESPLTTKELDTGFRVFRVDDSNMKDVYYSADEVSQDALDGMISNIKEDRSALDLLFGCLVDWGIPLSKKCTSETVDGHTIYDYGEGDLLACFDTDISESVIEAMAREKPLRAVFRDGCFSGSQDKINVFEIFKMLSPDTTIRVL